MGQFLPPRLRMKSPVGHTRGFAAGARDQCDGSNCNTRIGTWLNSAKR